MIDDHYTLHMYTCVYYQVLKIPFPPCRPISAVSERPFGGNLGPFGGRELRNNEAVQAWFKLAKSEDLKDKVHTCTD
jgi:hypothetical protein